jgi:hypothetical protein
MKVNRHSFGSLLLVLLLNIFNYDNVKAQDTNDMVRQTVDRLFNGMKTGDSTKLRSIFTSECSLTSISKNASDSVEIHKSSIAGFVKAVGTPHKEIWDERIYDVKISIDEPMAIVWAPYKFYLGEKFSHCGVNVFTLIHTKTGWEINGITDTRRKENCP